MESVKFQEGAEKDGEEDSRIDIRESNSIFFFCGLRFVQAAEPQSAGAAWKND